jgi:chromosome segregation ATPase
MAESSSSRTETRRRRETAPPLLATPRPNANALADERARLDADLAELRETEANLRAYEARLRAMQAELDAARRAASAPRATPTPVRTKTATTAPFKGGAGELQAEWDKLIRAREILEHEQAHLRGDRLALRDEATVVRRRAAALDERESQLVAREQALLQAEARTLAVKPISDGTAASNDTPPHLLAKLTMAPFAMGRSLLSRPKGKA